MPNRKPAAKVTGKKVTAKKVTGRVVSPYGYPFWEWVAKEDPEYVAARQPLSEISLGEGKALSIKQKEMVIIGILAYRGRENGVPGLPARAREDG